MCSGGSGAWVSPGSCPARSGKGGWVSPSPSLHLIGLTVSISRLGWALPRTHTLLSLT